MPYLEDGETWSRDFEYHEEGMAENRPGHKALSGYKLPKWCLHPMTHPYSGRLVGPKEFMYAAGDGFCNPMRWSIAHIGAKFGDVSLLARSTEEELSRQDSQGMTPASYAVQFGTAWCLQWLVEHEADTETPDINGCTPEDHIWSRKSDLDATQQEWLFAALKGELNEKNNLRAQEYLLVKKRVSAVDDVVVERMDQNMAKLRKYWFDTGDYELPYSLPPAAERKFDLPISKVEAPQVQLPPVPAALLFPGQGSQYVGMLKGCVDRPNVKAMLHKATEILGWDPQEIMLNGPEAKQQETRYCQPIMYLAGLAALDLLTDTKPEVVQRPMAVAGLSLGEYTAIVAAGVLTWEEGLRLVQLRAEAMQRAADMVPQAMCSVVALDRKKVEALCEQAVKKDPHPDATVKVANWLFPAGFTCGGTKVAVDELMKLAVKAKALQAKLIKTGGAFHTQLMQPAQDELSRALDKVADKMKPPRCSIYFNVTGRRVGPGADPATFIELMKMQLTSTVLWEPTVKNMVIDGVQDFYEVGPLKQIKAMIKRIDADAFKRTENVMV